MKKKTAKRPKLVANATALALLKAGIRKYSSRSTGSRLRRSISTNSDRGRGRHGEEQRDPPRA